MLHKFFCDFRCPSKVSDLKYYHIRVINYLFLKNYDTSDRAVSHNIVYYHQLSIGRYQYQVRFHSKNYFE